MLGAELLHLSLREVRVALDLVDRRRDRRTIEEPNEMLAHEVAYSNRADLALGKQGLERAVCLERAVERRRQRLVQDQHINLVDAQLSGALLEAVQRLVVSVVADPDLGLQEDLRPVHLGAVHGLANLTLVAVGRGSVDVSVARGERGAHCVAGLVGRRLKDAESEDGQLDAVVQCQGRCHGGFVPLVPGCSSVVVIAPSKLVSISGR
jgi:hypothetical protein